MKKIMIFGAALCAAININASTISGNAESDTFLKDSVPSKGLAQVDPDKFCPDSSRVAMKRNRFLFDDGQTFSKVEPSSVADSWTGNWFIGAQAGASVYVGKPLGCADAFDRISPNIHVYAGKWFTPAVGARLNYQGYEVKGCRLSEISMQSYHADLMYNVMSYRYNRTHEQRFDLIPYAGCGLIHNSDLHNSDFSLNYGIQAKYHLNDRLHLTAEVSGLTTFQQFDGQGAADHLGDHKFDVSLGLSFNIGKVGFKKVKAQPVAYNILDQPVTYVTSKREANDSTKTIRRKTIVLSASSTFRKQPVNDYSGLNSLRARLADAGKSTDNNANTQTANGLSAVCHCCGDVSCKCSNCSGKCLTDGHNGQCHTKNESATATLVNGADTLGLTIPYICYFKINTHDLTNTNQLSCLSEIVKLAQKRGMAIRVIGAADSATGTVAINQRLSEERANYIAGQLQSLGMSADHIQQQALGGIEEFTPVASNRYCKIQLVPLSSI